MTAVNNFPNETLGQSARAVTLVQQHSALNPLLWLNGILVPPLLFAAWLFEDSLIRMILIGIVSFLAVVTILAYFVLLIKHPEKLQSEAYQLRHEAMQLYQRGNTSSISAKELARLISNPGQQGIEQ